MTKLRRGLPGGRECWLALLLCGCGAGQTPGRNLSQQPTTAAPTSTATPGLGQSQHGAVGGHADGARSEVAPGTIGATQQQATDEHGLSLILPVNEEFVAAPIPSGQTARYESWRQVGQTRIGKGYLYFVDVLDERRLIVKSAIEPEVRLIERGTRRELGRWPIVNLGPDEDHVVLAWPGSPEPRVLVGKQDGLWAHAAESGRPSSRLAAAPVDRARWSPDGRILMTAEAAIPAQTTRLRFYQVDQDALRLVAELPQTERVDAWALSRDNRYLARVFYPSDSVTIVDLHTGQTLLDAPAQRYVGSVEFSPNGRWLALGGEGVKWFDLSNPTRRTEYTHFYNNVGDVEFSPSGDVLAVASYDGQVRLLTYDEQSNRIALLRSFSHQKNTNVYTVKFVGEGDTLVSSGGDQTVRYWAGVTRASSVHSHSGPSDRWLSPLQWAEWGKGQRQPADVRPPIDTTGSPRPRGDAHHTPVRLSGSPSPSRIQPGEYECKITALYKLRRCSVEVNEAGHTMLEFDKDNLLGLRGVLYDDGSVVRFEGWLTEAGSLGCANCAAQPLHAVFRGNGGNWQGLLLYRGHYDPYVPTDAPAANVVIEEAIDRFPLVLRRRQ